MKTCLQIAASLVALGGLLGSVASHATDIAQLPLKASVLAKPNVIFGLDDSGSMGFEVLLNTNDGAFWWDYTNAAGWDSTGAPLYNSAGTSSTQWRKFGYLFPNGTGTGDRTYGDSTNDHFAVPPTAQFAWLRSSAYNPMYYNPSVIYVPWAPGYTTTAVSFSNATVTAAKSHPLIGSDTMDLTTNQAATNATNFTFMGLPGMVLPQGAQYCTYTSSSCANGSLALSSWTTVGASGYTVPASTVLRVTMAYYPATYYNKETCTLSGLTCVAAPDGSTLKRYEIKAANYTTTALYNAAMQNFANWWQYYRKRSLMLSSSMGQVLEPLTGLRLGVVIFNNQSNVTMYDTDAASAASNGRKVAGIFYTTNGSGGTPTRETLKYIGGQYTGSSSIIQYACQRNNAFIVTDGFANASSVSPPSYTQATWESGVPYQTIYSNSLADIASSYYTNNLKSTLATGKVPANSTDANTNLHMNTYGMTLGAKGTIYTGPSTPVPTTASAWPNPSVDRNPTAVDDLWHATINGRGKMYTAATPTETAVQLQAAMDDILSATGAQGGVAVSTVNLSRGDGNAYLGTYNPAGWSGDLTANTINATTGAISTTANWSASSLLTARSWSTRQIVTFDGSAGAVFNATNVGATVNPSNVYGTTSDVIDYLRGNRALEGTTFRARTSLIGAVINSEPVISRNDNMVFIASGEGMLHAFDITPGTTLGKELWAFVPNAVLPDIGQTAARGYSFQTQLDGTPVIGQTGTSSKLLVAGMGVAGNSYYALDVSTPRTNSESDVSWVKWQFPGAGTSAYASKVGQTMGKPVIVNTSSGYRVLVTSGYNSTADGKGRLFVLDPATGNVLKEFTTTAGSLSAEAGLANVSAYAENDGTVQYVYGGDLLGNVWRFDLSAASGTAPNLLATLIGPTNVAQPVTAAPELVNISGKRVVLIGTGRLLDVTDFGSSNVQTFYAIADGSTLTSPRSSLVAKTYTRSTDTISGSTVDWSTGRGWYMDLTAGEQANTRPAVAYGAITFTTNVAGATDCSASSWFYVLDFTTGGQSSNASYVSQQVSSTANVSGVNAVVTSSGDVRGLMQTGDGQPVEKTIATQPTINPAKNSWREVRVQ